MIQTIYQVLFNLKCKKEALKENKILKEKIRILEEENKKIKEDRIKINLSRLEKLNQRIYGNKDHLIKRFAKGKNNERILS